MQEQELEQNPLEASTTEADSPNTSKAETVIENSAPGTQENSPSARSTKGLIAAVIALVLIIALAGIAYTTWGQGAQKPGDTDVQNEGQTTPATNNVQLPDFTMSTFNGQNVTLSSFYGKPSLVGFWATWCPPCNAEAPELQKLYDQYGDQVNFVMINIANDGRDTAEGTRTWLDEGGYTYPVYLDLTGEASQACEVYYLPTMYVLDAEGKVLSAFSGALSEEDGKRIIEQLLE